MIQSLILQRHPTGAPLWSHAGSSPGFQCSSPKCRGRAAWPTQPRCIHHHRRSSSASRESWHKRNSPRRHKARENGTIPAVEDLGHGWFSQRLTCWPGPAASAWAQAHHRAHRSVSPCHRTPWWCGPLCLWGSSCAAQNTSRLKPQVETTAPLNT